MFFHRSFLSTTTGLIVGLIGALPATLWAKSKVDPVSVVKSPPTVAYRVFDPAQPPAEIRATYRPDEAGLCQYEFSGKVRTEIEFPRLAIRESAATISSLRLELSLKITVWTMIGASPKVHRHEETHRQIAEAYYAGADVIGTRLARAALGRTLRIPAKNRDAATTAQLEKFQADLLDNYLAETATRCGVAQRAFDALTDHGRNARPDTEAMAAAVHQERSTRVTPVPRPD